MTWAVAADESGQPIARRFGSTARVYPAALIDAAGQPILTAELWVQEIWPALLPMGQKGVVNNASLDAGWWALRQGDLGGWDLGELGQRLDAGAIVRIGDGQLEYVGPVCSDDAELSSAKLPAYASTDRRCFRDGSALRELTADEPDLLNPGGGRMWIRPASTENLAEHLRRLETAVVEGGLMLAGRDAGSRWIEALHLKVRLLAEVIAGVRNATRDHPLGSLDVEAIEVIAGQGDHGGGDAFWSTHARLVASPARQVKLLDGRTLFLRPPTSSAWPDAREPVAIEVSGGKVRLRQPIPLSEGGAIRLRLPALNVDVVAGQGEDGLFAASAPVPAGAHHALYAVLPTRTAGDDAEDAARLAIALLVGVEPAETITLVLTELVRRLLKKGGDAVRLDSAVRSAFRDDKQLQESLGPHLLIGGWLTSGSPENAVEAAEAVPGNLWARLLTGIASMLPPFAGRDPGARLDSFVRTLGLVNGMTESLLTSTWRTNREVGRVLREVAGDASSASEHGHLAATRADG